MNKYGLTEVQDVTYHKYSIGRVSAPGCVGSPLPGCLLYVVQPFPSRLQEVERGYVGEIAVGGPQVATGYLGEPELSAQKFVFNSLAGEGRLFLTGDAGRWADDGSLVCLGRLADQHRVNGQLVDLQAAEAAIRSSGLVEDVAMTACIRKGGGEKELVAFYIPLEGCKSSGLSEWLRERARQLLPPHNLPQALHAVESFPLTSSGKIQRGSLQQLLPSEAAVSTQSQMHEIDISLRKDLSLQTRSAEPKDRGRLAKALQGIRLEVLALLKTENPLRSVAEALALFRERAAASGHITAAQISPATAPPLPATPTLPPPHLPAGTAADQLVIEERPEQGNLMCSALAELCTHASLHGIVQQEIGALRPVHVPMALLPSAFPAAQFKLGRDVLAPAILKLIDAAARDHIFLKNAIEGAAADEEARGEEPRLRRMLEMLPLSRQQTVLGILRTDWMLDEEQGLKQIETNTISAAFSMAAPRVQRLHARLAARAGLKGEVLVMRSDEGVVDALAAAHRRGGGEGVVLFVVLDKEHLLCESLMESELEGRHAISTATLTLGGCAQRLSLGNAVKEGLPSLLLDGRVNVTTVYFRGGLGFSYSKTR